MKLIKHKISMDMIIKSILLSSLLSIHQLINVSASRYEPVVQTVIDTTNNLINQTKYSNVHPKSGWMPVISAAPATTMPTIDVTTTIISSSKPNSIMNQIHQPKTSSSSSYMAINPSKTIASIYNTNASLNNMKIVPLVEKHNVNDSMTAQYLTSESVARNNYYQTPQNAYMINPDSYRNAFLAPSESIRKETTIDNKSYSLYRRKSSSSSSAAANKIINSDVMPIPMIKAHRNGATLGFNLPEQGLTLYLDINDVLTKPIAQNIGLKVVAHSDEPLNQRQQRQQHVEQHSIDDIETLDDDDNGQEMNDDHYTDSGGFTNFTFSSDQQPHGEPKKKIVKKAKFRYQMTNDSTTRKPFKIVARKANEILNTDGVLLSPIQAKLAQQENLTLSTAAPASASKRNVNDHTSFINLNNHNDRYKFINRSMRPSASRIPSQFSQQPKMVDDFDYTSTNKIGNTPKEANREIITLKNNDNYDHTINEDYDDNNGFERLNFDVDDDRRDVESNNVKDDNRQTARTATQTSNQTPSSTFWMNSRNLKESNTFTLHDESNDLLSNSNTLEEKVRHQEMIDNELLSQMQLLLEKNTKLIDMSTNACIMSNCNQFWRHKDICSTETSRSISNTSTTIKDIAQQLNANAIFDKISDSLVKEFQNFMDLTSSSSKGYTIILPSNEAVERLPPNLLRKWQKNLESFMVSGYMIDGLHTIESLANNMVIKTRGKSKLIINEPFNKTFTINGQRVMRANQNTPNNGIIHVINGLLYPASDKDIIDTLKSCGRFDGFVTLVEGTGFSDLLRNDGPFTVFVPSNDALQKVPDNDLEIIRRNMTALKEFLMYHVAQGAYYSQDLRDGQFIPSILDDQYLQTGVRVDGCSRRLVEVNVSPLYRADISASNGVIHVIDWILKPDDRDWCDDIILPKR